MEAQNRITLVARILFAGALVGVTILSIVPNPDMGGLESDKLGHFIAYAVLTLLLVLSLTNGKRPPKGFWIALASICAYGALIEVLQRYIGRNFDFRDMVANGVGALLGAGIGLLTRRIAT